MAAESIVHFGREEANGVNDGVVHSFTVPDGQLFYLDEIETNLVSGDGATNFVVEARQFDASEKNIWDNLLFDAYNGISNDYNRGMYMYPGEKIEVYESDDSSPNQNGICQWAIKLRRIL